MPVKKGLSYTQRTLRECRNRGYICAIAEKWNAYAGPFGQHEDLFGFIDIVALVPVRGILAIQSTGPHGHADHRKKILENDTAIEWLRCGGHVELWSWRKLKRKRGGELRVWTPRIEPITIDMFGGK
jgi:hypothetical protein